jgi:site-specific DNA recombinase
MRAGIYARISHDPLETTLGVQRQIEDCTAEAKRRGWEIVRTYTDNDVSATRSKVRPEYEAMLSDIRAGRIQAFVVWDIDRLTRTPRELEDIIDLADKYGTSLASVGGEVDLSTPQGKMTARIKGTVARHEAEQQSRRLKRRYEQKALAGEAHSAVAFGYQRVTIDGVKRDIPDPITGPLVVEAAQRFIKGEALHSIVNDWNARGIKPVRVEKWSTSTVRQMIKRPINAGKRVHRGVIVGDANAEPLMTEAMLDQIMARLNDPERQKMALGNAPKHLLTMIAKCGRCGGNMRRLKGAKSKATGLYPSPVYSCKDCFKLSRKIEDVDAIVTGAVLGRLQRPDLLAELLKTNPDEADRARRTVAELESRLSVAADQFSDGAITGPQLKRITQRITPKLEEARNALAFATPSSPLADLAGADAVAKWEAAPLDIKRQVIDALMAITIMPAQLGKHFDPELIKIEWK